MASNYIVQPIPTAANRRFGSLRRIYRALRAKPASAESLYDQVHGAERIQGMMVAPIEMAPENEHRIVAELVESYQAAKKFQSTLSGPYAPGAYWKDLLASEWSEISKSIDTNDIPSVADFLRNFFRNEALSGFYGDKRMFERFRDGTGKAASRAQSMQRQFNVWRSAMPGTPISDLEAPRIGNPWGYVIDDTLLYEPVCNYHLEAAYISRLLASISSPIVVEIGGGFGGLAYQIAKTKPRPAYIGFDLPENVLLQNYYVACAFPEAKILSYSEGIGPVDRTTMAKYDFVFLPNFAMPHLSDEIADLVINIRSLSEMPKETVAEYLAQVDRFGALFFFHENIFKARRDGLYGLPSSQFPKMRNFTQIAESLSRWPRYNEDSQYPCHENLFIRTSAIT